jgi:hypothetical protein
VDNESSDGRYKERSPELTEDQLFSIVNIYIPSTPVKEQKYKPKCGEPVLHSYWEKLPASC